MKRTILTAMLLCAVVLTGCDEEYTAYESSPVILKTNAETMPTVETAPTASADIPTEPEAVEETIAEEFTEPEPVPQPEAVDPTEEATEPEVTETEPVETVQSTEETAPITEDESETELLTEPAIEPEQTDYDKALEVYAFMLENGHGTCVNYACQTYEKCSEAGLPCYIVWTDAQLCGHVANTVQVDGIWYILDTQGQLFLTYNYGFTEVIDMEMNHVGSAEMLSDMGYEELQ